MTHKRSEKETRYLREIVGADGAKVHYFGGTPEQRREIARERKAQRRAAGREKVAAQVAEMRKATGTKAKPRPSARERAASQVSQMRKAAGNFKDPAK